MSRALMEEMLKRSMELSADQAERVLIFIAGMRAQKKLYSASLRPDLQESESSGEDGLPV